MYIIHIDNVNFDIYETTKLPPSSTECVPTFETTSGSGVEHWSQDTLTHCPTVPDEQSSKINQGQGLIYITNVVDNKHNSS